VLPYPAERPAAEPVTPLKIPAVLKVAATAARVTAALPDTVVQRVELGKIEVLHHRRL
jgi:hypothetical protein